MGYKFHVDDVETPWKTLVTGEIATSEKFYPDHNSSYSMVVYVDAHGCGGTRCYTPDPLKSVYFKSSSVKSRFLFSVSKAKVAKILTLLTQMPAFKDGLLYFTPMDGGCKTLPLNFSLD